MVGTRSRKDDMADDVEPWATQPTNMPEDGDEEEDEEEEEEEETEEKQDSSTTGDREENDANGVKANPQVDTPPNDESSEILSDLIEYECEMVCRGGRRNRIQHYHSAQYFLSLHPHQETTFGLFYALSKIVHMMACCCTRSPFKLNATEEDIDDELLEGEKILCLNEWPSSHWSDLLRNLEDTRDICLRKDVHNRLVMDLDESVLSRLEDFAVDGERSQLPTFTEKYQLIVQYCQIGEALAPIRKKLDLAIRHEKVTMRRQDLNLVYANCQNIKIDEAREAAMQIFSTSQSKKPMIVSIDALGKTLMSMKLDLEAFQDELEVMLINWVRAIRQEDPTLYALNYRIEDPPIQMSPTAPLVYQSPPRSVRREVKNLRKGRVALKRNHGADPLDQSRRMAAGAKRVKKNLLAESTVAEPDSSDEDVPSPNQKKKGATRLTFEDDPLESEDGPVQLSTPPPRISNVIPRTYSGPKPDVGVFNREGKVVRRRPWTEEEKAAVKYGVRLFGIGKWVQVKQENAVILRNRTAVQIKDCWRTMKNKGEIMVQSMDGDAESQDGRSGEREEEAEV